MFLCLLLEIIWKDKRGLQTFPAYGINHSHKTKVFRFCAYCLFDEKSSPENRGSNLLYLQNRKPFHKKELTKQELNLREPDILKIQKLSPENPEILNKIKGILFGRPGGEFKAEQTVEKEKWLEKYQDFDKYLLKVCKEYGCTDIPIVTHMDFGHTVPQILLPYGIMTEIDPVNKTITFLENAVE